MKKTQVTLFITVTATAALSLAPALRATPPISAEKRAQIAALLQNQSASRYTFREMMKDRDKKRYMAQTLAHDAEARDFFNAEVGKDGPHEERNPSQHPELFRLQKP